MKLSQALKKFKFLERLALPDKQTKQLAIHLAKVLVGDESIHITPLAKRIDPIELLVDLEILFEANAHKLNEPLTKLELENKQKFGPRSIAGPWPTRIAGLNQSYSSQDDLHVPKFYKDKGDPILMPISIEEAASNCKLNTSAGLPFLTQKGKAMSLLLQDFDNYLNRKDACMLYTRTTEGRKTRNVWGYPFADTLFEMQFYVPLLWIQKDKPYRAALVCPNTVAKRISKMIHYAMSNDMVLYSVDFKAYDASIKFQYIILAFEYIKSNFKSDFHEYLDDICYRMYTIAILTPARVMEGKHGVPSGSTFTNEVDSIVQFGIAMTCSFICENLCQIQGDDGVYVLRKEFVKEFEQAFFYAGLKLETTKSHIASDYVIFCQNLYHIDYQDDKGHIGGIYPLYRALTRLCFQEHFINFNKAGIEGKDYFGIRTFTILENCKYHPLFEEFVRFIFSHEKFSLSVSDEGIEKYCNMLSQSESAASSLNHQYGSKVRGIRKFESYKLVRRIIEEEALEVDESS